MSSAPILSTDSSLLLEVTLNFTKRIEAEVAEYRSGLTEQVPSVDGNSFRKNRVTLQELNDELKKIRSKQVEERTLIRNLAAMKNLIKHLGADFLVMDLTMKSLNSLKAIVWNYLMYQNLE